MLGQNNWLNMLINTLSSHAGFISHSENCAAGPEVVLSSGLPTQHAQDAQVTLTHISLHHRFKKKSYPDDLQMFNTKYQVQEFNHKAPLPRRCHRSCKKKISMLLIWISYQGQMQTRIFLDLSKKGTFHWNRNRSSYRLLTAWHSGKVHTVSLKLSLRAAWYSFCPRCMMMDAYILSLSLIEAPAPLDSTC